VAHYALTGSRDRHYRLAYLERLPTRREGGSLAIVNEEPLALTRLQEFSVIDRDGSSAGDVSDVIVALLPEPPVVTGLILPHGEGQPRARGTQVSGLDVERGELRLSAEVEQLAPAWLRADEIALVDQVLDKQVLAVSRRRLFRVQDVALERRAGRMVVTGVDTSSSAMLRRIGLGFLAGGRKEGQFIPWDDVNLISLRLSRPNFIEAFTELADLHPADIADIIQQVGPRERAAVLAALAPSLAADTLQEMDEALRGSALTEMLPSRAAAVLAEIDPDEAADMLAELPDDTAQALLATLPEQEAMAIRGLASHPEHSAGGLMTTDFVVLCGGMTVGEALAHIRAEQPEAEALSYIFVNDAQGALSGVVSLRDLVLARPDRRLEEIMDDDPVAAEPDVDEEEVGRLMTKYNLLALPVVDERRCLLGVVTLDDALDAIVPEEWKQRLPRLFR
jgi:magnesium transporter